jgi:hypothetical protein
MEERRIVTICIMAETSTCFFPDRPKHARQQHQGPAGHLAAPRDEVFEQRRNLLGPFGPRERPVNQLRHLPQIGVHQSK